MTPWNFPLGFCTGIPVGSHPGAFGYQRKHEVHTGVDLYTNNHAPVFAVENGLVVGLGHFTGEQDGSGHWENTDYLLVEGASGVVCYGEVAPTVKVGDVVRAHDYIANVVRVLKEGRERPDIPGHRPSMLHLELYPHGYRAAAPKLESRFDDLFMTMLLDPTERLMESGRLSEPAVLTLVAEFNSGVH